MEISINFSSSSFENEIKYISIDIMFALNRKTSNSSRSKAACHGRVVVGKVLMQVVGGLCGALLGKMQRVE